MNLEKKKRTSRFFTNLQPRQTNIAIISQSQAWLKRRTSAVLNLIQLSVVEMRLSILKVEHSIWQRKILSDEALTLPKMCPPMEREGEG